MTDVPSLLAALARSLPGDADAAGSARLLRGIDSVSATIELPGRDGLPIGCHCYLTLDAPTKALLVGAPPAEWERLARRIMGEGVAPSQTYSQHAWELLSRGEIGQDAYRSVVEDERMAA